MKILWLAPEPPVPPLTGGRERARRGLEYLAARHEVQLVTQAAPDDLPALAQLRPVLAGLVAVPYPPRPAQQSAVLATAVRRSQQACRPDAIHVQGLALWPYAPAGCRILDLHDAPLRLARRQGAGQVVLDRLAGREAAAVAAAAAVIVVTEADRQALSGLPRRVVVLPNGVDLSAWSEDNRSPPAGPPHILFPGALNWPPNVEAARWLIRELAPPLRGACPAARIVIAGRQPDPALVHLAATEPAVTLVADPPDMRPWFARATAVAVPLRAATGTRLKILQALAIGRPVVSTPVGAEGLGLEDGRHLLIAPLGEPLVRALLRLLADPALGDRLVAAGRSVVHRFAWPRLLPALDEVYPA